MEKQPELMAGGDPLREAAPSGALLEAELEASVTARVQPAMGVNGFPLVTGIVVENRGSRTLRDLRLTVRAEPGFAEPLTLHLSELVASGRQHLTGVDLRLKADFFTNLTERMPGRLILELEGGAAPPLAREVPVELCARNEWPGLDVFPELLAAFVQPNEPFVQQLLRGAAAALDRWGRNPALEGYQSKDPARVLVMVGAVYAAMQEAGLTYINPPASFVSRGQRVRLPKEVGEYRMATCLDAALTAAACLEQAGLHPLIVVVEGHAFCGVWLGETCFPDPVIEEPLRIRKRVELEEIAVFDPTLATSRPSIDFDRARREAERRLTDPDSFRTCVDIARSRAGGVLPIPSSAEATAPSEIAGIAAVPTGAPTLERLEALERLRGEPETVGPAADSALTRLDHWCRKLLDLTMRNRLLNFKPNKKTVPLLCADLGALEDSLAEGRVFRIQPRPTEMDVDPAGRPLHGDRRAVLERIAPVLERDLGQGRLRADLDEAELDKRLVTIYREARTAMEEGGSSGLYIGFGFLRFYETKGSGTARMAPILLLPVELTRASIQQGFRLSLGGDEPRINASLLELLAKDHDIRIEGLDPLPEDQSGLDVPRIFHLFRERIRDEDRWELIEETALGIFSFAKILLWKDLAERAAELLRNPVVQHLVEPSRGEYDDGVAFPDEQRLDETYSTADAHCPLSADSSQLAAVFAAAQGKSFVLEGPPGTGKSQTIANMVAHCLADGKSVLFVSEKMAALEVVHDRLQRVGLGEACLELHSNKAKKKAVLDQLRAAADARAPDGIASWQERAAEVDRLRAGLNAYVQALHRGRESGETPFQVLSRLIGLRDVEPLRLGWNDIASTPRERLLAARELIDRLGSIAEAARVGPRSTFNGVGRKQYTPQWDKDGHAALESLRASLEVLAQRLQPLREVVIRSEARLDEAGWRRQIELCEILLDPPRLTRELLAADPGELAARALEWIELGRCHASLEEALGARYGSDLEELPLDDLDRLRKEALTSWWLGAWSRRRKIRKALASVATAPGKLDAKVALKDLARALKRREAAAGLEAVSQEAGRVLGELWAGTSSDWGAIEQAAAWAAGLDACLGELRQVTGLRERCVDLALAPEELRPGKRLHEAVGQLRRAWDGYLGARTEVDRLLETDAPGVWASAGEEDLVDHGQGLVGSWLDSWSSILGWCRWQALREEALSAELGGLVEALEGGQVTPAGARSAFERTYAEDWYTAVASADPELRDFYSPHHERAIERFRQADKELLELTEVALRARVYGNGSSLAGAPSSSEAGVLQRELTKKSRHMAIRRLFREIPTTLRRLKPCVLMSPLSVAQYLDPSHPPFDVVVFDEASQIPIWDAIGAIARGRQAVVVGDPKQLPPTSFFSRSDDDEEGDELAQDMESILDECAACNLPTHRLRWHYRSRHESLIAFSNRQYYENRLVTFPACHEKNLGVSWRYVTDGVFDRGRSRTNRAEADVVVEEIVRRLTDPTLSAYSLGVVTFNQAQQMLIQDLLDQVRKERPELDRFFSDEREEKVFVKNLENVQGDERDVILFSIGYGPDAAGKVYMNFGPMTSQGGERRLNVAVTRARREVVVISSLRADQIDLARSQQRGVRDLKLFLEYAEKGPGVFARETSLDPSGDPDSPFEEDVARKLRSRGVEVHAQVGCSAYRIDLAVLDPDQPGRYLLGVECDGASYHSSTIARDRDKLRQAVLEGLGWRLHRIWSSDWWRDPEGELEKVEAAIRTASLERDRKPAPPAPVERARIATAPTAAEQVSEVARIEQPAKPAPDQADPGLSDRVYVLHQLRHGAAEVFYDSSSTRAIADALVELVEAEQPITVDFATRRIGQAWGFGRVTRKASDRILEAGSRRGIGFVDDDGVGVLWMASTDPDEYTGFRVPGDLPETQRPIAEIPTWELGNAAMHLVQRFGRMEEKELLRATGRLFGFKSLGSRVAGRLSAGVDRLVKLGRLERDSGYVQLPS